MVPELYHLVRESESLVACTVISAAAAFFLPSFGSVGADTLGNCKFVRRRAIFADVEGDALHTVHAIFTLLT